MSAPTPQLTEVTSTTFWEFVGKNRFVLVHFWAAWNGSDFVMRRLLESQLPVDVFVPISFAHLDVDKPENQELRRRHNVLNVPFLAFYRDGVLVRTVTGMRAPEIISEHLKELVHECAA